jgi:hypothetical protein
MLMGELGKIYIVSVWKMQEGEATKAFLEDWWWI